MTDQLPNIDDMEIRYLQANGATSNHVNNAWKEVFFLNGATSQNWNTAAQEFLVGLGAPYDNLPDNWKWFWCDNGGVIAPQELFYDSFTDPNGTLITAHNPNIDVNTFAAGWVNEQEFNPNQAVINNGAVAGGSASYNQLHIETLLNNCRLQATHSAGVVSSPCGIMFRKTDVNNLWTLTRDSNNSYLALNEREAGNWVNRDVLEAGLSDANYPFTVEVILSNDSISYSVGGFNGSFQSSANLNATKHGIRVGDGRFIDDYRIFP